VRTFVRKRKQRIDWFISEKGMCVALKQPRGDGERCVTPARAAAKETTTLPHDKESIFNDFLKEHYVRNRYTGIFKLHIY